MNHLTYALGGQFPAKLTAERCGQLGGGQVGILGPEAQDVMPACPHLAKGFPGAREQFIAPRFVKQAALGSRVCCGRPLDFYRNRSAFLAATVLSDEMKQGRTNVIAKAPLVRI